MKKKFIFVSDFDGTISKKDFYWIVIDKYFKEAGEAAFKEWKEGKYLDIEFLGYIFKNIGVSEDIITEDILNIPVDDYIIEFIDNIKAAGGDFAILSAGTDYYIKKILKENNIENVTVFSNHGNFKDNGIYLDIDESSPYYSKRYGIDKKLIIETLKKEYEVVFFAGDSEPDVNPSSISDFVFSKPSLTPLLKEKNIKSYEFNSFNEIEQILKREGVL